MEKIRGYTPESEVKPSYRLHFEPGRHITTNLDSEEMIKRYVGGDLKAHLWNEEVARRMRKYSPRIVSIDGLNSTYVKNKRTVLADWLYLPGSPQEMTGSNSIYVVSGDVAYRDVTSDLNSVLGEGLSGFDNNAQVDLMKRHGIESGVILAAYLTSLAVYVKTSKEKSRKISRRSFLKKTAAGTASLGLASLELSKVFSSLTQAYLPNNEMVGLFREIVDITRTDVTKSVWLEGRTALTIQKTLDTAEWLGLPNGSDLSVVMGYDHNVQVGPLLQSEEVRLVCIRNYAEEFYNNVFPLLVETKTFKNTPEDQQRAKNITTALFSLTDVSEVSDPGVAYTSDLDGFLQDNYKEVGRFLSPQVVKALNGFGDPTNEADL